ncbi:MAG: lipoprotein-releasing ABC transporter permease subunit [Magnetococcales bacterium]|nr:lipoprotein-releasing ABC transporter permease subunit [Magnetococcales bacterium]
MSFFRQRYEWIIGLRYLRAKRSEFFISVITFLSMGGVALGVAALITVLAVMTGFREELQRQILGVTSHVTVRALEGNLGNHAYVLQETSQVAGVVGAAPYISIQAMVSLQNRSAGVMLRGIDPEQEVKVSSLARNVKQGTLDNMPEFGIILGRRLARHLYVELDDAVTVTVAVGSVTAVGTLPRMRRFKVVGIFDSGMYEYDNSLAYVRLEDAQKLLRLEQAVTGVALMTTTPEAAFEVGKTLRARLGEGFWVQDWMEMNRSFFRALQMEKAVMFVILLLVVLVAAFNIISSLIMVVMEKGKEIAILKTLGAGSTAIMKIFIINGGVIGVVGTAIGTALGLLLSWNLERTVRAIEQIFGIQLISGQVYFIDHIPAKVLTSDVAWITGMSLTITLLATLYPAWRASQVDPVEALRYE